MTPGSKGAETAAPVGPVFWGHAWPKTLTQPRATSGEELSLDVVGELEWKHIFGRCFSDDVYLTRISMNLPNLDFECSHKPSFSDHFGGIACLVG